MITYKMTNRILMAKELAEQCHATQTRKNGKSYMADHIEKVVMIAYCMFGGNLSEEDVERLIICAYLHDAVEDTTGALRSYVLEVIKGEFSDCYETILRLTHHEAQEYQEYVSGIAVDMIARKVKIADIMNNMHDNSTMRKKKLYRAALDSLWATELGLT